MSAKNKVRIRVCLINSRKVEIKFANKMAQKFLEHINLFLESDSICETIPSFSNKKKIKTLIKESEERLKFVEKYSDSKKMSPILPILNDKVSFLKSAADKFENLYNEMANLRTNQKNKKEQIEKQGKNEANVKKLKDALQDQIEGMKERFAVLEREMGEQSMKYAEEKQAALDEEFNKYKELVSDRHVSTKENELLKQKRESILKDIDTQGKLMDKDYDDKRVEVSSSKLKNINSFDIYKKELDKKDDYEKEKNEAKTFCDLVHFDLSVIENSVQEYEKLFNNSIKDFEKPLRKVEKIKKESTLMRKENEDSVVKLSQNNSAMLRLVEENQALRNRLEKEAKQQAILRKLVEDLELKIKRVE